MAEFVAKGTVLSSGGLDEASQAAGVSPAEIWSVLAVETSGCGFLPDRCPKLLFERHILHRLTAGRFDAKILMLASQRREVTVAVVLINTTGLPPL